MIDLMAYLGGIFLMISFVPQVVRTWNRKSAEDISLWMLLLTLISSVFYQIYAVMLHLTPVIIMNGVFLVLVVLLMVLKLVFDGYLKDAFDL